MFGGGATAGSVYNLVKEYNPLLDTWTNKANIPTGRWGLGSCIIGSEIYLIGGADAQNNRLDNVEVYRPELDLTDINEQDNLSNIPKDYKLYQNFPNPFNPSITISWQSSVGSWQTLKVYDILGNEVATLVNEYRNAGNYEIDFQSSVGSYQLSNGVYFYQLRVGAFVETKKMILLK